MSSNVFSFKKGFVSRGCRQLVLTGTYKIVLIKGSMYYVVQIQLGVVYGQTWSINHGLQL